MSAGRDKGSETAMRRVPFIKYSSCGNNFIIVDETAGPALQEREKPCFARQATNLFFGVGADGCIFLQASTLAVFGRINDTFQYWRQAPNPAAVDYIFRLFEPDGSESLSCGNGLLCVAHYIRHRYGAASSRVMTEIPSRCPRSVSIGTHSRMEMSWTNMGMPRPISRDLVHPDATRPFDDVLAMITSIDIHFRKSDDVKAHYSQSSISLRGYLIFTGEPHLVLFCEEGIGGNPSAETLFPLPPGPLPEDKDGAERRVRTGSWLVDYIGQYIERSYAHYFPKGINIDFARLVNPSGILEYRCYERGISRETLACGTGALAIAYVARRLGLLTGSEIAVWPHRCRWYKPNAALWVRETSEGWFLQGHPIRTCDGDFIFEKPDAARSFIGHVNVQDLT